MQSPIYNIYILVPLVGDTNRTCCHPVWILVVVGFFFFFPNLESFGASPYVRLLTCCYLISLDHHSRLSPHSLLGATNGLVLCLCWAGIVYSSIYLIASLAPLPLGADPLLCYPSPGIRTSPNVALNLPVAFMYRKSAGNGFRLPSRVRISLAPLLSSCSNFSLARL